MSVRQYFKPRDGLPDPKGSLSTSMSSLVIASANREVEKALEAVSKKRGPYRKYVVQYYLVLYCYNSCETIRFNTYTPAVRAQIGKYACQHGSAAASSFFSKKLGENVSKTSVQSIKVAYLECVKKKRSADSDDEEVTNLPTKKRGRPFLLGEHDDQQLQMYLRKIRDHGGIITASVVVAAARGILMANDRSKLVEFGGHIELNRHWAYHLLDRMKFVRRKATTSKSRYTPSDFAKLKQEFLDEVASTVTMEEIPPELILNWDQTGIHLVPAGAWTMDQDGSKRVEITGVNDKRQITAVFCGTMIGDFLPIQVIYQGKTDHCHPHYKFPNDWHVAHSPKHWSTEETMVQYIEEIIVPYVESTRDTVGDKPALVIMDNFKGQKTSSINQILEDHNIHVSLIPPNTTDLLQPMDVAINKPAKDFFKKRFEEWYSQEVTKQLHGISGIDSVELEPVDLCSAQMKELSTRWLVEMADYISHNPQFIVNGFMRSGITPALDGNGEDLETEQSKSDEDVYLSSDYDSFKVSIVYLND